MAGAKRARSSPLIYPRAPAREAESELNLLKISRFPMSAGVFTPSSAPVAYQYIKFPSQMRRARTLSPGSELSQTAPRLILFVFFRLFFRRCQALEAPE